MILCTGAIFRAVGNPLSSISEISLCLFAWCVFLGADTAYRHNKLVYVELIIDGTSKRIRRALYAVNYALIAAFLGLFIYLSVKLVMHSWVRTWSSIPSISYGWIALCMPVGCGLMLVTTCIQFYKYVIKGNDKQNEEALLLEEIAEEYDSHGESTKV